MAKTQTKFSQRQASQARRRRQRQTTSLIWISIGFGIILILGFLLWGQFRPASGEAVPIPADYETHIQEATPPWIYPSDPPAGGIHYASELDAKFYHETDAASIPDYPEGYLVHNLEHGYVIFWYNCEVVGKAGCERLISQLQDVIDTFDGVKVMAFPWKSLDVPVAATSSQAYAGPPGQLSGVPKRRRSSGLCSANSLPGTADLFVRSR